MKRDSYTRSATHGRELAQHPSPLAARGGRIIGRLVARCRQLERICRKWDDLAERLGRELTASQKELAAWRAGYIARAEADRLIEERDAALARVREMEARQTTPGAAELARLRAVVEREIGALETAERKENWLRVNSAAFRLREALRGAAPSGPGPREAALEALRRVIDLAPACTAERTPCGCVKCQTQCATGYWALRERDGAERYLLAAQRAADHAGLLYDSTRRCRECSELCLLCTHHRTDLDYWLNRALAAVRALPQEAQPGAAERPPAAEPAGPADDRLLWGLVRNAGRSLPRRTPRWAAVRDACGIGSTAAQALCRRFGADPDEMVGQQPDAEEPDQP